VFGWEGHFIIIWPLMNTDERGYFDSLTERVLGAVFEVSNSRGAGFLEKVYQRALLTELRLRNIRETDRRKRSRLVLIPHRISFGRVPKSHAQLYLLVGCTGQETRLNSPNWLRYHPKDIACAVKRHCRLSSITGAATVE